MSILGSVEVLWGLGYQVKSLWGGDGSFHGRWVRADGRRSSSGKRETPHQLLTGLHRDLQQNHDTVDRVTGGRKWDNIHRWAWCERHSNWHSNPTGVGNRSLQRHDTNRDKSVTVHCSSLISGRRDVLSYRGPRFHFPRGMFSEVDVRFASSFHALCSRHFDPPELLHLADSCPMDGRNVALVAAMNTPTTFLM